jgi:hypothetical protein
MPPRAATKRAAAAPAASLRKSRPHALAQARLPRSRKHARHVVPAPTRLASACPMLGCPGYLLVGVGY